MSFEKALDIARTRAVTPPPADQVFAAVAQRTATRAREFEADGRWAARWLYLATAAFLLLPIDPVLWARHIGAKPEVSGVAAAAVVPACMLAWAARLAKRPSFGAQLLVRAIAASNLVVALVLALSIGGAVGAVAQVVAALACAAFLLRSWDRGLEGDPQSSENATFAPVRFRGFLTVALIMAFADAQTLAFAAVSQAMQGNAMGGLVYRDALFTGVGALVMALNVWGLYRLRVWAMLTNIAANMAIAVLALNGTLGLNMYVAMALAVTALIQLLLPVPILATALGDRRAGQGATWRWGSRGLLVLVVALTASTIVAAWTHRGLGHLHRWMPVRGSMYRGVPSFDVDMHRRVESLRAGEAVAWADMAGIDLEGADLRGVSIHSCQMGTARMAGADARGSEFEDVMLTDADLRGVDFRGASLIGVRFERTDLRSADFRDAQLELTQFIDSATQGMICPDGWVVPEPGAACAGHLLADGD